MQPGGTKKPILLFPLKSSRDMGFWQGWRSLSSSQVPLFQKSSISFCDWYLAGSLSNLGQTVGFLQQALKKPGTIYSFKDFWFFDSVSPVSLCLSHTQDLETDQQWSGWFFACCCLQPWWRDTAAPAAASASTSPLLWLCSVLKPVCCSCPPPSTARLSSCDSLTTLSPSSAGKTFTTWLV